MRVTVVVGGYQVRAVGCEQRHRRRVGSAGQRRAKRLSALGVPQADSEFPVASVRLLGLNASRAAGPPASHGVTGFHVAVEEI